MKKYTLFLSIVFITFFLKAERSEYMKMPDYVKADREIPNLGQEVIAPYVKTGCKPYARSIKHCITRYNNGLSIGEPQINSSKVYYQYMEAYKNINSKACPQPVVCD